MDTFDQITVKLLDGSLAKITVKYVSFLLTDFLDDEPEDEYDDMLPCEIGSRITVNIGETLESERCTSDWWELMDIEYEGQPAKRMYQFKDVVMDLAEANRYEAWLTTLREKGMAPEVADYYKIRPRISQE